MSASLVISTDFRAQFGPARHQGKRPTCMAFAASDGHAHTQGSSALCPEYLFFKGIGRTSHGDRTRGIPLSIASAVLEHDGQPEEEKWPYEADLLPSDEWGPPDDVEPLYRCPSTNIGKDLDLVWRNIESGTAVMLVMDISRSFYSAAAVINAPAGEVREGTHAVLGVGTARLGQDRLFLIRNSWGARWGDEGYAWIHEEYLATRLIEAGIFDSV